MTKNYLLFIKGLLFLSKDFHSLKNYIGFEPILLFSAKSVLPLNE